MKKFSALVLCWCAASVAAAECLISNESAAQRIETYQTCLDGGLPVADSIDMALGFQSQGDASRQKSDFKAAVDYFDDQIADVDGDTSIIYFHRALANLILGKERRALTDLETVNTQIPDYAPGHFYRGMTLFKQRKYRDAVSALDTAIAISTTGAQRAPIYFAKAQALSSTKSREAAIATYGDAINSDATYAKPYFERARLQEKEGRLPQAIEDYSKYIELRPAAAEAYHNRGLIYQDLRQDHLAIADFNRAIERNPDYLKARASKGFTYLWPILPVLLVLLAG